MPLFHNRGHELHFESFLFGVPRADPGFSGRGFGQTSAYIIYLLLFNKSFFTRKSTVKIFAFVSF